MTKKLSKSSFDSKIEEIRKTSRESIIKEIEMGWN